ncbi:MAG: AMP-binding protein, partial [Candidatus Thiodiazotropha sp. 6PLUC3]
MSKYAEIYKHSLDDPQAFWGDVAQGLHWDKPWDKVLDESAQPSPRWFVGGQLNTCFNALDRHIDAGNGDRLALIYDSPVTDQKQTFTYYELRERVARLAGALTARGVEKGDRVIVYMPMIPEAAIAMLACARIGAIHSVVFGGFAAKELATRIDDSKPKMVLSASCGIEPSRVVAYKPLLDEAIELSQHKPDACIINQRPQLTAELQDGRDSDW